MIGMLIHMFLSIVGIPVSVIFFLRVRVITVESMVLLRSPTCSSLSPRYYLRLRWALRFPMREFSGHLPHMAHHGTPTAEMGKQTVLEWTGQLVTHVLAFWSRARTIRRCESLDSRLRSSHTSWPGTHDNVAVLFP